MDKINLQKNDYSSFLFKRLIILKIIIFNSTPLIHSGLSIGFFIYYKQKQVAYK